MTLFYRLLYFNSRGAAEPIRYFMVIHGIPFDDVRYPIHASAKGFGVDDGFLKHQSEGRFHANLNKLPILQIVQSSKLTTSDFADSKTNSERIIGEIGQTHAILRFLENQQIEIESEHSNVHARKDLLQMAYVDAFVESIRDIKSEWYKAKRNNKSGNHIKNDKTININPMNAFLHDDLPFWCEKLEKSLPPRQQWPSNIVTIATECPWLIDKRLSLADITLYALLATPTSITTGSSQSFFDGATSSIIQKAYQDCDRISTSIDAMSKLPAIKKWEDRRPDTFN